MIVVDVNIVAYLLINGRKTALARQLHAADGEWRLPPLWRAEFLNVLVLQITQGGFGLGAAEGIWTTATTLLGKAEVEPDLLLALHIAAANRITACDAQYLALAEQLGIRCVTEDRELLRKFPKLTVEMAGALRF